jgi:predicted DNA-binding transcriptional regulator YafY
MPANLNALIRYKTINSALYGGNRRWSIPELTEKCSSALAEYRGRYKKVSERTIRDDIRVMRSDILGYNAPISMHEGLYYYADPEYSIMTVSFTDSALLERIIHFLREIKPKVAHPELEIILEKLDKLKICHSPAEKPAEKIQSDAESPEIVENMELEEFITPNRQPEKINASRRKIFRVEEESAPMASPSYMHLYSDLITWGDIFLMIKR